MEEYQRMTWGNVGIELRSILEQEYPEGQRKFH
jgi:hypothetical protein